MKTYKVQAKHEVLGWRSVPFAEHRTRAYCDGWVTCMDSFYPSSPMRIICIDDAGDSSVVRETKGRAKPHTN